MLNKSNVLLIYWLLLVIINSYFNPNFQFILFLVFKIVSIMPHIVNFYH